MKNETEIPLVCDLSVFTPEERTAHLDLATEVAVRWPSRREELPDGYRLHYRGDERLFLELARFAAEDHRCCPWLTYALEIRPFRPGEQGELQLRLITTAAGKALLLASIAALDDTRRAT